MISTGPSQSVRVGNDILDRGGSAVDAALASALARITLDMGHIVSFAGIYMMVYYEAKTGKVYSLNACFKTPLEEYNPLSIPREGIPNARGVMVPGFMAGVQAAHDRFGKLPSQVVFQPAIDLAENGFPVAEWMLNVIREHWHVVGVLPEARNIFLKRRYGLFRGYEAGDIFIQPELAHTLRQVVSLGGEYMYTGDWGRHFVDIVRREGGNITLQDMEEYEPVWAEPAHTTYNGYDIHALGYPSLGAMNVILGLNLMECANLAAFDHCTQSADALFRLMYCSRVGEFFYFPYAPEIIETHIPEGDFSYESRADKENARRSNNTSPRQDIIPRAIPRPSSPWMLKEMWRRSVIPSTPIIGGTRGYSWTEFLFPRRDTSSRSAFRRPALVGICPIRPIPSLF